MELLMVEGPEENAGPHTNNNFCVTIQRSCFLIPQPKELCYSKI